MPATIVQKNEGNTGTSVAPTSVDATLGTGTTAGSGRYVLLFVNSNATVNTPSGFTKDREQVNNSGLYVYRKSAANGETTWTITPTSAASTSWAAMEVSGLAASSPLDQVTSAGSGTGQSDRSTGTTSATTQASEWAVAAFGSSVLVGNTITANSYTNGFAEQADNQTNLGVGTNVGTAVATKDLTVTGTQESTVTWSGSCQAGAIMATYKVAAATSSPPPSPMTRYRPLLVR